MIITFTNFWFILKSNQINIYVMIFNITYIILLYATLYTFFNYEFKTEDETVDALLYS